jgi:hypothetical protein
MKDQESATPANPPGMTFEVHPSSKIPGGWTVDAINFAGDGEFYTAIFVSHNAKERAEEYAAWKNSGNSGVSTILPRR